MGEKSRGEMGVGPQEMEQDPKIEADPKVPRKCITELIDVKEL